MVEMNGVRGVRGVLHRHEDTAGRDSEPTWKSPVVVGYFWDEVWLVDDT